MGKVQTEAPNKRGNTPRATEKKYTHIEQDGGENNQKGGEQVLDDLEKGELDAGAAPQNFTICAPQLLHLGTDGRPLWFNGWILSNKFDDEKKKEVGTFEVYMMEPKDIGEVDAWKLIGSNICCLTADQTVAFEEREHDILETIIGISKEAHVYGKR